jgi:hexosaminidase
MVYPRAIALSQALWCTEKPSFNEFEKVLIDRQLPFLRKMNVHYAKSLFSPKIEWKRSRKGVQFMIQSNQESEKFQILMLNKSANKVESGNFLTLVAKKNFILEQAEWVEINRAEKGKINYEYYLRSTIDSIANDFVLHSTHALGVPVKYVTNPSSSYNSGDLTLVDGQHGSLPWKRNEWIGFDTTEIEIEIDLLKKQKYKQLKVSFLSDEHSWIHFPERIEVFYLSKGNWKRCTTPVRYSYLQSEQVRSFQIDIDKPTRNVLFKIKSLPEIPKGFPGAGHVPWTFIDEIEVVK